MNKPQSSNPFEGLLSSHDEPLPESPKISSRVKGKKASKDYVPSMTYLPKSLKLDVQQQLITLQREGIDIDFSELVAELLTLYLDIHTSSNPDIQISNFLDSLKSKYSDIQ